MAGSLDDARLTDFGSVFRVKSTRRLKSIQLRTCPNILRECRLSRNQYIITCPLENFDAIDFVALQGEGS